MRLAWLESRHTQKKESINILTFKHLNIHIFQSKTFAWIVDPLYIWHHIEINDVKYAMGLVVQTHTDIQAAQIHLSFNWKCTVLVLGHIVIIAWISTCLIDILTIFSSLASTLWTLPSTTWTLRMRPAAWRPSARWSPMLSTIPWPSSPSTPSSKTSKFLILIHLKDFYQIRSSFSLLKYNMHLSIPIFSKSLSGLERYQDAIDAGMNGQDCALIYDQCPFSYFGYWNWFIFTIQNHHNWFMQEK